MRDNIRTHPLGEISYVIRGVSFNRAEGSSSPVHNHLPILRAGNIQDTLITNNGLVWVPRSRVSQQQYIKKNDLIMCTSSGSAHIVGKCAMAESDLDGSFGAFCVNIRAKKGKCNSHYLFHFLRSPIFTNWSKGSAGINIKNIRKSELEAFLIPLPPLNEQKRITAILDKADAIRRKRRQAIQLADEFLRSVFIDMFGDPATNNKQWEICSIDELLSHTPNAIRTGPFGSQLKHSEFTKKGIPVLGIDNIVTNEFRWTVPRCLPFDRYQAFKRYKVFPDDVIVTIMGTTGRVAVIPSNLPECMSTKHLCVITLKKEIIDPVFLWATLLYDRIVRNQAKISGGGAIMEGWNMTIIKRLKIRVPPKDLQTKFRSIYDRKVKLIKMLRNALKEENMFFNSLSQLAFRGEL